MKRRAESSYAQARDFGNTSNFSKFQCAADVHLANSNQYNRINETKQAILFGDSSFATSVTNNLMQRIENRNTITYSYRYVKMTHRFSNDWDLDNCYIYSPDFKIDSNRVSTFDELAGKIVKCSEENPSKLINVLVNQEDTRRNIYTSLVNVLKKRLLFFMLLPFKQLKGDL